MTYWQMGNKGIVESTLKFMYINENIMKNYVMILLKKYEEATEYI